MRIRVRMMGVLSKAQGNKEIFLELPDDSTVGTAIKTIISRNEVLKEVLWDTEVDSPSPNALIMLNGVEIKNLQGTDTPLMPDQELVLLSVVHGG
jgi:molybdopterin converting factor small subunit